MISCLVTGLSYCRHLKTVRTHLSGLVNSKVVSVEDPSDASKGLTVEVWRNMGSNGEVSLVQNMVAAQ